MPIYALDDHRPALPEDGSAWVAPDAHLIGQVTLEEDVSIWFGAILRGDNEPIHLGRGTNIQENVVIHTDPGFPVTLGAHCTIGHGAIVHGCLVGEGALIGMGATVLNGAKIGSGCLIGAGALVTEGKEFAPGSLIVGSPARAVRALDPATQDSLRETANRYVENQQRFKKGLKIVG